MELEEMRNVLNMEEVLAVEEAFDLCGAKWTYQKHEGEPHALLTSGKHSDGYFNVNAVIQFPNFCKNFAWETAIMLTLEKINNGIDAVISSSYAALPFGKAVADALGAVFVFTEKQDKGQVWTGRFELPRYARVLQVEELITTMGTTENVRQAVIRANPNPVEFVEVDSRIVVATIVHRPENLSIEYLNHKVFALMEKEVHNYTPEECPLCEAGSEVLKPKPNWEKFSQYI
jgi:orotate phosphoribosyltransferase